jgi:hypothetical protein
MSRLANSAIVNSVGFRSLATRFGIAVLLWGGMVGCQRSEPVVIYTIPTRVPEQLQVEKERMLAAIVPKGDQVWFFKVNGPQAAVDQIETQFRDFVRAIRYADGLPVLTSLPDGWRRGGEKAMRFATLDVETPGRQLNISISQLDRQSDWDEQVKMNVNRWRGQLGLASSEAKWAAGQPLEVAEADTTSVWVDLLGDSAAAGSAMSPPLAGISPPPAAELAAGDRAATNPVPNDPAPPGQADPRLKYVRPPGWREGRMSSMRMAAFSIGPEDSPAELTVIPAGGDLRGNVARWLGQVRQGEVSDEVIDQAMAAATIVDVDGRKGQRFLLTGEDASSGTAIDATIVPIEGGMSLFVKMTGPAQTVSDQSDEIASFLESLELDL